MVFDHIVMAGLTLKGKKCHIGLTEVSYLGHVFSGAGMGPDLKKVQSITEWPTPTDVSAVRKFLGLASYYRRYISHFADVAAPLQTLTEKGKIFIWTSEFVLQTDASAIGVGAVLEQDNHVVAYATKP